MWRFTRNNGITQGFHTKMEVFSELIKVIVREVSQRPAAPIKCSTVARAMARAHKPTQGGVYAQLDPKNRRLHPAS